MSNQNLKKKILMGLQTAQTGPMCCVAKAGLQLYLQPPSPTPNAGATGIHHRACRHLQPLIALTLSTGSPEKTDFFFSSQI